jgi:methylglyoxal/glyoxal reductase
MIDHIGSTTVLNNGIKMPWLGLGVYKTNEGEEVEKSVIEAVAAGYRSIDTAKLYGNEAGVGRAIKACGVARDELFITTKVWNADQGFDSTIRAFEESRKKLDLEVIDLYLIHWPGQDKERYLDTWRALEKLYADGAVRAIGVSNFKVHHLEHLFANSDIVPAVNQVEYHPLHAQRELLAFCRDRSIQLEAWSPLMRGNLDHPVLNGLSEKLGKTPAQIILRWDLQNGVVTIPKSVTPARIRENAAIFDFDLSAADMASIDRMDVQTPFGPDPDSFVF